MPIPFAFDFIGRSEWDVPHGCRRIGIAVGLLLRRAIHCQVSAKNNSTAVPGTFDLLIRFEFIAVRAASLRRLR